VTIPAWVAPWIGLPYQNKGRGPAYDCWGLVRAVMTEAAGYMLPDYADAYTEAEDSFSVSAAIGAGLAAGWQRVENPQPLDLLILRIAARPWHCAVVVAPGLFLHVPPPGRSGRQSFSCIERLDSPHWSRRIEGFYRRVPSPIAL